VNRKVWRNNRSQLSTPSALSRRARSLGRPQIQVRLVARSGGSVDGILITLWFEIHSKHYTQEKL